MSLRGEESRAKRKIVRSRTDNTSQKHSTKSRGKPEKFHGWEVTILLNGRS